MSNWLFLIGKKCNNCKRTIDVNFVDRCMGFYKHTCKHCSYTTKF